MIKVLEQAIEKVKTLSEDQQRYAADLLEQVAAGDVYVLSDEERRLIQEARDEIDRGEAVSDADMQTFWNRHRS